MYPLRCLRIPPGVRVPQIEYRWFRRCNVHVLIIKSIVHDLLIQQIRNSLL
jgi:hypothetical protein